MLSKNNAQEVIRRQSRTVPHYGLRKLSIGVASVLLSTTLYAGVSAQADTLNQPTNTTTTAVTQAPSSSASDNSSTDAPVSTKAQPSANLQSNAVNQPAASTATPVLSSSASSNSSTDAPVSAKAQPSTNLQSNAVNQPSASTVTPVLSSAPSSVDKQVTPESSSTGNPAVPSSQNQMGGVTNPAEKQDVSAHNSSSTLNSSLVRPRLNLAVQPKARATNVEQQTQVVSGQWTIHYRDATNQKELMPSTTIYLKYQRQIEGDGINKKFGDWQIVPKSFGYQGTEVTLAQDSLDPIKTYNDYTFTAGTARDSKEKELIGHNLDGFEFTINSPEIKNYHPDYYLIRLTHYLVNDDEQADKLADDLYVNYSPSTTDTLELREEYSIDGNAWLWGWGDDSSFSRLAPTNQIDDGGIPLKSGLLTGTVEYTQNGLDSKLSDAQIDEASYKELLNGITLNNSLFNWYVYENTDAKNSSITLHDYLSQKGYDGAYVSYNATKMLTEHGYDTSPFFKVRPSKYITLSGNIQPVVTGDQVLQGVELNIPSKAELEAKINSHTRPGFTGDDDYWLTKGLKANLTSYLDFMVIPYKKQNMQVTRQINLHLPTGLKQINQVATLSRVETKKYPFTYSELEAHSTVGDNYWRQTNPLTPWTTAQWTDYDVPVVNGYKASVSNIDAEQVTDQTKNKVIDVYYTSTAQSLSVKYVDDEAGGAQVGQLQTLKGTAGSKVATNIKAPTNYVLSGTYPAEYTFTDAANQQLVVHLKHAKQSVNDQKTVTRTVNYTDPKTNQTKLVERQTATLNRTGTKDLVTNNTNWNAWSTDQFKAVSAPSVAGYQVTNGNAAGAMTVNDQSKDTTVTFTYTANAQTTHVKYVDKDNPSNVIHTTNVSGKTNQTINVPSEVPAGWQLVSGQQVPTSITFTDNGYPDTTVKIEHKHTTVTPDQPKTPSDKLPDNPTKSYPVGVGQNDLNKTITRTIQVTDPHTQKVTTTTQPVHLTRTADVDEVSGAVTYGKWTTGEWPVFNTPNVPGYTPTQANVTKTTVTDTTKDQTVKITYSANPQTTTVNYVDPNNQVIHSTPIKGVTDQTVSVPNEVPAGWKLSNGSTVPANLTFGPTGHPVVTVHIEHQHVTVTPDHPKTPSDKLPDNPTKNYPAGVDQNDLNKTITRTIKVVDPHTQKVTTATQPVHLTRTADVDEITGAVKYGNWTTGKWDAYVPAPISGYTPSVKQVDALPVTATMNDETVTITYAANPQEMNILYVDHNHPSTVVKTQTITGKTDQIVSVPNAMPAGWKLTPGQKIPEHISFSSQGHDNVVIEIEHAHVTVTPDQPKMPSDKLPDNPTKGYPAGVAKDDLNKTITRTIQVIDPHTQQVATTTQPVHLTRTADVDEIDGTVTYGKWTTGEWPTFNAPVVAGYTPSQTNVAKTAVMDTTKDQTVKITYTANPQSTTVNYVDQSGKVVHSTLIKGVTDQTVKVPSEVPAGWKLVDGQAVPKEVTFGPDGYPAVTVKIEHGHVTVTPDKPIDNGTKLPDNPSLTYQGVTENDLNKVTTRTINVKAPNGKVTTTKQTAHLTRTATIDEVTGQVTYGKWTTGTWDAFTAPREAGYTPTKALDKVTVTDQTRSETLTIEYTANPQSTSVQLVDRRGKVVQTTKVNGHTDETVPVSVKVPNGWKLVAGEKLPTEIHFTADGHPIVQVTVEHGTVKVTPDHPYDDGTPLPDNPDLTFHGVDQAHLNKLVTRTINVKAPNGKTTTEKQMAHLTRSATVDEVTGAVTYEAWTTGEWQTYEVPAVPGYTPNQAKVDQQTVTSQTQDQTVNIEYTANAQSTTVTLVDPRGKEVVTDKIDGHTDETVPVPTKVPAGWQLVPGEELPTEITFGPDGHPAVTVKIEHRHVTVTADHPYDDGTPVPDNAEVSFHGVSETDLNRTITRTIVINVPGQSAKTVTQEAHLTRSATVDEATGAVVYEPWTTAEWPEFDAPAVDGYEPDQTKLPNVKVMVTTPDQTVVINYHQVAKAEPAASTTPASPATPAKQVTPNASKAPQQASLPQTGNDDGNDLAALGLLAAGTTGMVLSKKKRQTR